MVRKNLKLLSVEELEASAIKAMASVDRVEAIRARYAKLRQEEAEKLRAIQLEIESRAEATLENMLTTRLPSGFNDKGMDWLQHRSWKGEWKGTGLGYHGSSWHRTNQFALGLRINHKWSDEQLAVTAQTIEETIGVIKSGQYGEEDGDLKLMSKGSRVALSELKVLEIQDYTCCEFNEWKLALMPDSEWVLFDARNMRWQYDRARLVGSLVDCLKEIRQHFWADGGVRPEEDY